MKSHRMLIKTVAAVITVVAGALLQPLAVAQSPTPAGKHSPMQGDDKAGTPPMSGGAMGMQGMDMKGMMKDNNDKMSSMKMTGKPDVDFAMMMRIHHQGAIDMAQAEIRDGKDPQMKKMAAEIIKAQKKEIAQFDKFLAKYGHSPEKMSK